MKQNTIFLSGVLLVLIAVLSSFQLNASVLTTSNVDEANVDNFTKELMVLDKVELSSHIVVKKESF